MSEHREQTFAERIVAGTRRDWRAVADSDGYHVFTPHGQKLCICDDLSDAIKVIEMGRVFDAALTLNAARTR